PGRAACRRCRRAPRRWDTPARWPSRTTRRRTRPRPPPVRAEPADLAVGRDADAEIALFFARLGLLGAELLVVDQLQGLVERALVVPGVVGDAGGDRIGELVLGDQVLAPHIDRIHADFPGVQVDHPFAQERGSRATGA